MSEHDDMMERLETADTVPVSMTPPSALTREQVIQKLVDKFLAWPLPDSVCSDLCATKRGYPHRSGTTLLTADEATQMFAHVLTELFQALAQQAQEVERLKANQRREPTENETVCHACDGSGWVDR